MGRCFSFHLLIYPWSNNTASHTNLYGRVSRRSDAIRTIIKIDSYVAV